MKAFLTGGTGFLGGRLCEKLRERGDDVVALVRTKSKAAQLEALGCETVAGDLSDTAALERGMRGCDAVFHVAAMYAVGIPKSERPKMYEANVIGTEKAVDTAVKLGIPKIVYVSTMAAIGDTDGQIVDETFQHREQYRSYYEETKHLAHKAVQKRIAAGAPVVIVMPGGIYGPGDTSAVGDLMGRVMDGKLPALALVDAGFTFVYVDDVADGIVAACERGRIGESYILGGEIVRVRDLVQTTARAAGAKPPRFTIPTPLVKLSAPFGPLVGKIAGLPPNLRELIASADNVTYWGSHEKATRELDYHPRNLEAGMRETVTAKSLSR